jgi:hypothetical protein
MGQKKQKQPESNNKKQEYNRARTQANKARRAATLLRQQQRKQRRFAEGKATPRGTARAKRRACLQPEAQQQAA